MTCAYNHYFNSQEHLKTACSLLHKKDYQAAARFLAKAREASQAAAPESVFTENAIQSYTTSSILLIATNIRQHRHDEASELQQQSVQQLSRWGDSAATPSITDVCRYCCQLLITGCQHSRCLGHCIQQLEEKGYAQEQT